MPRSYGPVDPITRLAVHLGAAYTEMNTILRRIRRRASGEPTAAERERLAQLKATIRDLKTQGRSDG